MATEWTAERIINETRCIVCENIEQRKKVFEQLEKIGFKKSGMISDTDLCISPDSDFDYTCYTFIAGFEKPLAASVFLTPTNPLLVALKKELLEIADSGKNEDRKQYDYYIAISNFIDNDTDRATDIANLIINSEI